MFHHILQTCWEALTGKKKEDKVLLRLPLTSSINGLAGPTDQATGSRAQVKASPLMKSKQFRLITENLSASH